MATRIPRPKKQELAERIAAARVADGTAEERAALVAELVKGNTRDKLADMLAGLESPVPTVPEAEVPPPGAELERTADSQGALLDRERLALLRRTLASDLTDDEFTIYASRCNQAMLDPFANQIHAIVRKPNSPDRKLTIQTGIDGFRLIADRTGNYAGSDEPIYEGEVTFGTGQNVGHGPALATVTVHKIVQGRVFPTTKHARWDEYYPGDGPDGFMWRRRPYGQLAKCAEALALRAAFPADLSGIYSDDEMDQAGAIDVGSSVAGDGALHDEGEEVERWRAGISGVLEAAEAEDLANLAERWKKIDPPLAALAKLERMRDIRRAVALVRSVLRVEVHPADVLPKKEAEGDGDETAAGGEGPGPTGDRGETTGDGGSGPVDTASSQDTAAPSPPAPEPEGPICVGCGEPIAKHETPEPVYGDQGQTYGAECAPFLQ